jgi:hypothetical protein
MTFRIPLDTVLVLETRARVCSTIETIFLVEDLVILHFQSSRVFCHHDCRMGVLSFPLALVRVRSPLPQIDVMRDRVIRAGPTSVDDEGPWGSTGGVTRELANVSVLCPCWKSKGLGFRLCCLGIPAPLLER